MEGGGEEDAHASAHDLVERRQERFGFAGEERVDQDRVLPVAQHVRRHSRWHAVPGDREPPEPGSDLVEWGHDTILARPRALPVGRRLDLKYVNDVMIPSIALGAVICVVSLVVTLRLWRR